MASGYCWASKVKTISDLKLYVIKKIKSLYVPFVICNGSFVILGDVFLKVGIYSNNSKLLALSKDWPVPQSLYMYHGVAGTLKSLIKVILFIGPTQLGTATWFLTSLFLIVVLHTTLDMFLNRFKPEIKNATLVFIFVIVTILTEIVTRTKPQTAYFIKCFPCTYFAFLLGIYIRKVKWNKLYSWWMGLVSFIILCGLSCLFQIEVSAGSIGNIFVYLIASLCGWVLLKTLSRSLTALTVVGKCLAYLGKHTMVVLCLHVLCFKIVSMIYILFYRLDRTYLAAFHIIFDVSEVWKVAYLISGVIIPVGLYQVYYLARLQQRKKEE